MYVEGARLLQGYSVGILKFSGKTFAMPPGDVGNPTSYPFPVLVREIPDVPTNPAPPTVLPDGSYSDLVKKCISAAQQLEADGVHSIAMWRGFFSLIQPILAQHVSVPILTSPLIMLPVVQQMMPVDKSIAVVVASKKLLTPEYFEAVNARLDNRIVTVGLDDSSVFNSFAMGGTETGYNFDDFAVELCDLMDKQLAERPDIGAIMLECTSLPPFAARIHTHTKLPIYDFIGCVEWMHRAVIPKTYNGYI